MSSSSSDIPDCVYPSQPTPVFPKLPTPKHSLYLSNLDDQKFLRFTVKHLYVYQKAVPVDALKSSLSRLLDHYYPLAGRVRPSEDDPEKLQIDCNGQGALFVEAFLDLSVEEFLRDSKPHPSWKKLHYQEQGGQGFLDIPPLVIQVTYLRCGGMIICAAVKHCMLDGYGSSQFLNAWGHMTANPDTTAVPVAPFHSREILRPRRPPQITRQHPEYTVSEGRRAMGPLVDPTIQTVVPTSFTFSPSQIREMKKLPPPAVKCTTFEALASHVWRAWVRALDPPPSLRVKLLFSASVRGTLRPKLPEGYYGNSFVMACAETTAGELVAGSNLLHGVERVQEAKRVLDDEYVRSMIDLLEVRRSAPDLTATLVISQSAKLGLENVDFGEGKPLHMGPLTSEIHCLFAPVAGVPEAVTSVMSVPESVVEMFESYMQEYFLAGVNEKGDVA